MEIRGNPSIKAFIIDVSPDFHGYRLHNNENAYYGL